MSLYRTDPSDESLVMHQVLCATQWAVSALLLLREKIMESYLNEHTILCYELGTLMHVYALWLENNNNDFAQTSHSLTLASELPVLAV
jgi:hypothetical protein